jgi:hypothetical protein
MARIATVKFDATHDLYYRTLGLDASGRKPKFWLGSGESVAGRQVEYLELLWFQVEQDWFGLPDEYPDRLGSRLITKPERFLWDELTLAAIAGHAGQSLHQVFDACVAHLLKLPDRSGWYGTQTKQTQRLKANHADIPLAQRWAKHRRTSPSI